MGDAGITLKMCERENNFTEENEEVSKGRSAMLVNVNEKGEVY